MIYDAIKNRNVNGTFLADPTSEHAQELTLAGVGAGVGAGLIERVEIQLRSISSTARYTGNIQVSMYVGAGGLSGALISTRQVALDVMSTQSLLLSLLFEGVLISNSAIWIGFTIAPNILGGLTILGVRESQLPPNLSIGTARGWNTPRAW